MMGGKHYSMKDCIAAVASFFLFIIAVSSITVSYDNRSLLLDGERKLLISGSVHYARSTPGMWPEIMKKAKNAGIDVIETYVFWNIHEEKRGAELNFSDNYDLVAFLQAVQDAGMYANLRIGPYVCAEWNYGGLPAWLRDIPDMKIRTRNAAWEAEVTTFLTKIVKLMSEKQLWATQGGPIILAQIENEYGNVEFADLKAGRQYMLWNAQLARDLNVPVPWIMCQQDDSPQDIIATCNGFYCHDWIAKHATSHPTQPHMFTEQWQGWYQLWDESKPQRPVQDVAYSVARWFAAGGSLMNYYMLHGGTNFGRTSGGPFVLTSYDYNVMIDEFGDERQPDFDSLKALHAVLHDVAPTLLAFDIAKPQHLANNIIAYVYGDLTGTDSNGCVAFLVNQGAADQPVNVAFNQKSFSMPAWSVSILQNCRDVIYNTATIAKTTSPFNWKLDSDLVVHAWPGWEKFPENEIVGLYEHANTQIVLSPLEQISITKDTSDYLILSTNVDRKVQADEVLVLSGVTFATIHVRLNGEFVGFIAQKDLGVTKQISFPLTLLKGSNHIEIISSMLGMINYGIELESWRAGILGSIVFRSADTSNHLVEDITSNGWMQTVGLLGEAKKVFTAAGSQTVEWLPHEEHELSKQEMRPTWFKTSGPGFTLPVGLARSHFALHILGATATSSNESFQEAKGEVWVNGHSIGRYWSMKAAASSACNFCDYRGSYDPVAKCRIGCGEQAQEFYHVPADWLVFGESGHNHITILSDFGTVPATFDLVSRKLAPQVTY